MSEKLKKTIPSCPDIPALKQEAWGRESRTFEIKLITPMFGGGVEAGMSDPTFPIRGTSIRGQLQFWWRATRGASCENSTELFSYHAEVWGTTQKASPVDVFVRLIHADSPQPCARYESESPNDRGQARFTFVWNNLFSKKNVVYVLFPFQGVKPKKTDPKCSPEKDPASYIRNAKFKLTLRYPKALRQDIETAMWAWVNFGGLGARTRRGCGSLYCKELAPKQNDVEYLKKWYSHHINPVANQTREWPTMPDRYMVSVNVNKTGKAFDVWNEVIGLWQYYRQGKGMGRNVGQRNNRPGRSRWPEPESIRGITTTRSHNHPRLPYIPDDAFPRAELGLPINFQFSPGQNEPPDTVLYPASKIQDELLDRMASPVILKSLMLENGQSVPLIFQLNTPRLERVDLRQNKDSLAMPNPTNIQSPSLATYKNSPLYLSDKGSALKAFSALCLCNDFTEITL